MLISILLLAAQTADTNNPAMMFPERVRYEFVFEVARKVCPALQSQFRDGATTREVSNFLDDIEDRVGITSDHEKILLTDYCVIYSQGASDKR